MLLFKFLIQAIWGWVRICSNSAWISKFTDHPRRKQSFVSCYLYSAIFVNPHYKDLFVRVACIAYNRTGEPFRELVPKLSIILGELFSRAVGNFEQKNGILGGLHHHHHHQYYICIIIVFFVIVKIITGRERGGTKQLKAFFGSLFR